MLQTRGYIFRLYPTDEQKELIEKTIGCSRYIHNYFLGENPKYINAFNCIKSLPSLCSNNPWLKEVDSCSLRCSIFNLEDAFKRYKNKLGETPKFKSKNKSRKSYRTNNIKTAIKDENIIVYRLI